jgi:hypothetical protein
MLKGAIHVHSTYSDGEFTLRELREVYMAAGLDFVCMTDHAEFFDQSKIADYLDECRSLSDNRFSFIAGMEFSCRERMHVLGFGVTSIIDTPVHQLDPQAAIRHIKCEGGVSVIAHPMEGAFEWIETFDELPDGIETWNSKYDGRIAPRPGTFLLLDRLKLRSPAMRAFYGQDMHWKNQYRGLINLFECQSATREGVLRAMTGGRYVAARGDLELPSSGALSEELLARFGRENASYARRRKIVKRAKQLADRIGVAVPAPLKSQLRRIF